MEKTKVLVTGASGMLGSAVLKVFSSDYELEAIDKDTCDITNLEAVKKNFLNFGPDIVVHTAAYTDVDCCELNPDTAYKVNALGTKNIASASKETGSLLLHLSTDYIFDGRKDSAYSEEDRPCPLNVYGRTKLEAEKFVESTLDKFLIVRTSWLYGENGRNFVDTIIKHAGNKKKLEIVNDQIGSPTYAKDLAGALKLLIQALLRKNQDSLFGIYNITNSQSCSWYEFAKIILCYKNIKDVQVLPITSQQLDRLALRPQNSRLDNTKFSILTGSHLRPWPEALREYLK